MMIKLMGIGSAITVWLLTFPGFLLAQDSDPAQFRCEGYYIEGMTFDHSLNLDGVSCRLQGVTVNGDLTVYNAEKFTIQNGNVNGAITVISSGEVDVDDTKASSVVVTQSEDVLVSLVIADIHIKVINNTRASVYLNSSNFINCKQNTRLVGFKNTSNTGTNCTPFAAVAPVAP